jgi:hypothetical protein
VRRLAAPSIPSLPPARPVLELDFMVELVGPRTVTAAEIAILGTPAWSLPLGEPTLWVMAGADTAWRRPSAHDAAYDSVALTWRIVRGEDALNGGSAEHLTNLADQFAAHIQRRAMPLPNPSEIDERVLKLQQLRDGLDVGLSVYLTPIGASFRDADVARLATEAGLTWEPNGLYEWRTPSWSLPLLGLGSAEGPFASKPGSLSHSGLDIGFHVPSSPAAPMVLERMFELADDLAETLRGVVTDEEDRPLDAKARQRWRADLEAAISALERVKFPPGSPAALALFGMDIT